MIIIIFILMFILLKYYEIKVYKIWWKFNKILYFPIVTIASYWEAAIRLKEIALTFIEKASGNKILSAKANECRLIV